MIVTPEKTLKVFTSLDCNKDLDDQLGPILHLLEDLLQHAHHPLQLLHGDLKQRLLTEHLRGDEEVGQLLGVQLQRVHVGTYQAHYCPSIPGLLFVFPETGLECRGY